MNRRGFTLIELIITIGIIGLLAAIGFPRITETFRRQKVISARDAVISLHAAARTNAVQRASRTVLAVDGNILRIYSRHPVTGRLEEIGTGTDFADRYGVIVSSTRDSLWFDPRGLGMAPDSTRITVTRGVYTQSVFITPLGRVR